MPGKAAAKPPSHFLSGRHTPFESWLQHNANTAAEAAMQRPPQRKELLQQQLSPTKPAPAPRAHAAAAEEPGSRSEQAAQAGHKVMLPDEVMPDADGDAAERCSQGWQSAEDDASNSGSDCEHMTGSEAEDGAVQAAADADWAEQDSDAGRDATNRSEQAANVIATADAGPSPGVADLPSLTHMDAGAFTSLPPPLQQELVNEHLRSLQQHPAAAPAAVQKPPEAARQHCSEDRTATDADPGVRAAAAAGAGIVQRGSGWARGAGTPVRALPPASQLDAAVLDALPLVLKRELERAYGASI